MPFYTVQVTIQLWAKSEHHAYTQIVADLHHHGRLELIDSEVIDTQPDEPPDEGDDSLRIMNESH